MKPTMGERPPILEMTGIIPVEHARWVGSLLGQLTDEQLRDAFRAANFDAATVEGYVRALRERINQLARL